MGPVNSPSASLALGLAIAWWGAMIDPDEGRKGWRRSPKSTAAKAANATVRAPVCRGRQAAIEPGWQVLIPRRQRRAIEWRHKSR